MGTACSARVERRINMKAATAWTKLEAQAVDCYYIAIVFETAHIEELGVWCQVMFLTCFYVRGRSIELIQLSRNVT
jgi:hypothetical protein